MQLRILGPVEALNDAGPVALGGPKQRLLVAVLALHHPHAVSSAALVDALWGDDPPPTAAKTVQVFVARLRKALGEGVVVTRGGGYGLGLDGGDIDSHRFEDLLKAGRAELAAGRTERGRELLEEALSLWRGPALADLTGELLPDAHLRRLEERRLTALEERIDADLALGRHADVVGELEALIAAEPLRERPRAQLMLALYRSGRQADALAAFQDARRTLVDEVGLEPGPELRRLQAAILEHDPELEPARRPEARGTTPAERPPSARRIAMPLAVLLAAIVVVAGVLVARDGDDANPVGVRPDSVAVLDARSGRVVDHVRTGSAPVAIAAGGGAVWVASAAEQTVERIDPDTRRVTGRIGLGRLPSALAFGEGALWVSSAVGERGTVSRLEPASAAVVSTATVRSRSDGDDFAPHTPSAIAAGHGALWANRGRERIVRLPARGGRATTVRLGPEHSADGLAIGRDAVWVASSADDRLLRIDARRGRVAASIRIAGHPGARVAGPYRVAEGAGAVWVTDAIADRVSRVDTRLNAVTATIRVGRRPTAVAAGPEGVWVLNAGDGTAMRIDPGSNAVTAEVRVPDATDLALAAGSVWISVAGGPAARPAAPEAGPPQPVVSRSCSEPWPRGASGDVVVVSDLPTWLGERRGPVVRDMRRAIRTVLDDHGYRAGRHRILYQECDDSERREASSSSARCAQNARAYAANPAVVGVIGPYHSYCATIALPILNGAPGGPVAMVSPSNTYVGLTRAGPTTAADEPDRFYPTRLRSYVRTVAPDQRQGEALALFMARSSVKRAYLLDDAQGTGYAVTRYVRSAARRAGIRIVGSTSWPEGPEGAGRMSAQVQRARPDAVLLAGCFCTGGYEVLDRLQHDLSPSVRYFGSDAMMASGSMFEGPHPEDGLRLVTAGRSAEGATAEARRLLTRLDPDRPLPSFEGYVIEAAIATEVLLSAIERSDGTRGSVVDALRTTRLSDGVGAGLRFDAAGDPVAPVFTAFQIRDRGPKQPLREVPELAYEATVALPSR